MGVRSGYKKTDVGIIPEEWGTMSLSQLSDFITKGSTPTTYGFKWEENGVLFLRSECVSEQGLDLGKSMFISTAAHAFLRRSEVRDGDILITITGNVGRVVLLMGTGTANMNQHIARIRISSPLVDVGFVYHFLSQPAVRRRFNSITTGQAYPQISLQQVREAEVAIPLKPEQRTIVESLSDMDALIASLDRLIAKKRNLKQAAMQQLLTGQTRLPGFSGEWKLINMTEKSVLKARIGWQGLTTEEYRRTGDYLLVTGTDFSNGGVDWSKCWYVDRLRYVQDRNIQLTVGDILLTKDGSIGKVGFVDSLPCPATLNSGVFVIRPKKHAYVPQFLYFILASHIFEEFLTKLQAGSTISHLYQKDFTNFTFKAPEAVEQTAIVEVLSDMDADIAALEARRDKTRALKQGMMQELLTGRIRMI